MLGLQANAIIFGSPIIHIYMYIYSYILYIYMFVYLYFNTMKCKYGSVVTRDGNLRFQKEWSITVASL